MADSTTPVNVPAVAADIQAAVQADTAVVADGNTVVRAIKVGYKTSEFWLNAFVQVVSALALLLPDNQIVKLGAVIGAALSGAGYAVSRGLVKRGV